MNDAFTYCAQLVRTADRDRFLASLFAPAQHRDALCALYAFNVEIARVRDVAREAMPGEIRLQWWDEVLGGGRTEEAGANPVAAALRTAIERYRLPVDDLTALVEARRFDLYDEPMASMRDLDAYLTRTSSALIALAANVLGVEAKAASEPAGLAYGIAGLLRAFPQHAARHQIYVPADVLARHGAEPNEILAGHASDALDRALGELRDIARGHLAAARNLLPALPRDALPAFLPVALVRPSLDLLQRRDAFAPADISPWRRQWLIWRAARNPRRIAG